jgi:hypothetical protein
MSMSMSMSPRQEEELGEYVMRTAPKPRLLRQSRSPQCYGYLASCPQFSALQRQNSENSKQIFTGKELRGYSPNSYIHVSVSDLYIPLIGLTILLQEYRWAERGNI